MQQSPQVRQIQQQHQPGQTQIQPNTPQQQQQQQAQTQQQLHNIVTIPNGTNMTPQQIQQQLQFKYQQQQQAQQQQQQQQVKQQQQVQQIQAANLAQHQTQTLKSGQQILIATNSPTTQFTLAPQFQTVTAVSSTGTPISKLPINQQLQQQQQQQIQFSQQQQQHQLQIQQQQQQQIAKAAAAASPFQAGSPSQPPTPQQTNSSPSSSVKILNSAISNNLNQLNSPSQTTLSPLNQNILSNTTNISSPIKIEPHSSYAQQAGAASAQQMQLTPASPAKPPAKIVIKTEDGHKKHSAMPSTALANENEYETDLTDITELIGIDLAAEKKTLLDTTTKMTSLDQIRGCKDEKFLNIMVLHKKFVDIAKKHKLDDVSADVATLVSHATQEYLRSILEKLNIASQHRLDNSMRTNDAYEMTNDVKSQMRFIDELDKIEKKKKDEAEREKLLKAAKSRSKGEDVELTKLKQKAKEVIQAESDELRRQDANKTALAAIGPRKKRKLDETSTGTSLTSNRIVSVEL